MNYPSFLPCPQLEGYQIGISYGSEGVVFENGNSRRRRQFQTEVHTFSMSMVFTSKQLWDWQTWANRSGFNWHWMSLASDLSGSSTTSLHNVRYIGDFSIEPVDAQYFKVTVQAEMNLNTALPSTVAEEIP